MAVFFKTPEEKAADALERARREGRAVTGSEMDGTAQKALKSLVKKDGKKKVLYDGNDRSKPDPFHPDEKTTDENPFLKRKKKQLADADKMIRGY